MKHGHVVLAKAQMLEAAAQLGRLDEQIGDDDDQRPLANRLGQLVQQRHQLRAAARLDPLQADRTRGTRCAGLRRGGISVTTPSATHDSPTASPCCIARYASAAGNPLAYSIFVMPPEPKSIEPLVSSTRQQRRFVSASNSLI